MAKKKTGRMMYVPKNVINELDNIMKEEGMQIKAEGFRKLVNYAKKGRGINIKMSWEK